MDILPAIAASRRRSTPYSTAVMGDVPVAYWRLGEASGTVAADELGLYSGTFAGSPTLGASGATAGNTAVTFSATQYVTLPHATGRKPEFPLTLEAWVMLSESVSFRTLMNTDRYDGSFYYGANMQVNASNRLVAQIGNGGAAGVGSRKSFITTSTFPAGVWLHFVAVWPSASVCRLYANGVEQTTTSSGTATTMAYSSSDGRLALQNDGTIPLSGSLDEVAIYSSALSADRILAHYNARNNP